MRDLANSGLPALVSRFRIAAEKLVSAFLVDSESMSCPSNPRKKLSSRSFRYFRYFSASSKSFLSSSGIGMGVSCRSLTAGLKLARRAVEVSKNLTPIAHSRTHTILQSKFGFEHNGQHDLQFFEAPWLLVCPKRRFRW